jgi:hypothetical protein
MSILMAVNRLFFSFPMVYLGDQSWDLFFSFYTPLHSAPSFLSLLQIIIYMQMIPNFMSFSATEFCQNISHLENTISLVQKWMSSNFLSLNPSKTEFLIIGLRQQLAKLIHPTISLPNSVKLCPVKSARNLGVIFDSTLSYSEHISAISKSCFNHIRDLRRLRSSIDQTTACTIATALIYSKLDYCNSLLLNLPASSTNRLQFVLNSAARAVTKTSRFHHITPVLKSLHWLKINQRIHNKVISLTYKILLSDQPSYLRSLLSLQSSRSTRSSSVVTLTRPSNPSRLKITNRSFYHTAPALWNNLPTELRAYARDTQSFALSTSQFLKKLKTYLFHHSFPP